MDDESKRKAAEALVRRGLVLYSQGAKGQAIRLWRSALELDPRHPHARRYLEQVAGARPELRDQMTERIDSSKLEKMLAECRQTGSHATATGDQPADEFSAKTQPVVPEELVKQAAQSWVDSPEDNLEITVDDHLVAKDEEEVDILDRLSAGTVSLEEWTDSRSPVPADDELTITVEEPSEEAARDDLETVGSEAKKPRH